MIHDLYYIATPRLWLAVGGHIPKGIMALAVNEVDLEGLKALYTMVQTVPSDQRFCLLLNSANPPDALLVNDLIAFFFFSSYQTVKGNPELIIYTQSTEQWVNFVNLLMEAAKAQGFDSILTHYFRTGNPGGIAVYQPGAPELLQQAYRAIVMQPQSSFFVRVDHPGELEQVRKLLEEEEAVLQQQEPELYCLLQKNGQLASRVQQLEQLSAAAAQEIAGQTAHMEVLRSESQAAHLQNYYSNEYEILPRWYKRFGHVVKVMMGKRSFRSLFNDKIKKYKQ